MSARKTRKILLSLDALYDYRQGLMTLLSPDFAVAVTKEPAYYTRMEDVFSNGDDVLDKELAKQLLVKYPKEILKNSLRTKILDFVFELGISFVKQAFNAPFYDSVELVVNTYPLKLSADEKLQLIQGLIDHLGKAMSISVQSISPLELTPSIVSNEYLALILYEYVDWFNIHSKEIEKKPLREQGFYLPRRFNELPSAEHLEEAKKYNYDTFEVMTKIMSPYAVMQFLPIAFFCADTPQNLPEYRDLIKQ